MNERFWKSVQPTGFCWLWIGYCERSGYGAFRRSGERKRVKAHRYAYEELIGPIPDGLVIDHLCRVKNCVNPDHLEAVTSAENTRRHWQYVRYCRKGHLLDGVLRTGARAGRRHCKTCDRDAHRAKRWSDLVE